MTSMFKRILKSMAVVPMLLSSSFAAVSVWDGTVDDSWYDASLQTYNLTSAAQLAGLAKLVNAGKNFSGKTVTLGVDIMLNDTTSSDSGSWVKKTTNLQWTPIGNNSNKFAGEFDGIAGTKNRKVLGLFINDSSNGYKGLFGYVEKAKIKNLDLINGYVRGSGSVAALAGRATETTSIDNIYSNVNVVGNKRVGGIAGYLAGTIQRVTVEANVTGVDSVGGLVGFASGAIQGSEKYPASFVGSVSGKGFVGGIVGRTTAALKFATAEGPVEGTGSYVGGVVGYTSLADGFTSVSHIGDVKGDANVGGVGGYVRGYARNSFQKNGTISGTNGVGGVVGFSDSIAASIYSENTNVAGTGYYVGGVLGSVRRALSNSYHNGGSVTGKDTVGGLVGKSVYSEISSCYSIGDVSGTGSYVGGLVGQMSSTYKIQKSQAVGNVFANGGYVGGLAGESYSVEYSYHKGKVQGANFVGGVAGKSRGKIDSVYHVGGDVVGTTNVGGVVGYAASTISKSYSESYVSGVDSVGGVAGTAAGAVNNVHATKTVLGYYSVGGVIGRQKSTLDSAYFVGDSVIHNRTSNQTSFVAGGISGFAAGAISNSYATTHVKGWANVGGIVGSTNSAISNCNFKGSVYGENWRIGGIAGITSSTIKSSNSEADVTGTVDVGGVAGRVAGAVRSVSAVGQVVGLDSVGGIAGFAGSTIDVANYKGPSVSGRNNVGGIAGYATGIIDSSSAVTIVTGSVNRVGGAVGYSTSDVTNVFTVGTVTGVDTVGGVAGFAKDVTKSNASKSVTGRDVVGGVAGHATGAVSGSFFVGDSVTGRYRVGGLLGYAASTVGTSYSTADVRGRDDVGGLIGGSVGAITGSYATGDVTGADYAGTTSDGFDNIGGLVGYASAGSVATSFASGNVSGTKNVGGLMGRFDGTKIDQSYASGDVTGFYYGDEDDAIGNYNIGGLVGFGKATISQSYVSGAVTGIVDNPVYTGCFVGYASGTTSVGTSYYDATICKSGSVGVDNRGESNPNATVSGSPAKSTANMLATATYSGWSTSVWKLVAGSYPVLAYYNNSFANAVIAANVETYVYDGAAKKPAVTSVALLGKTLVLNTDYTVTYENNVNAGSAMIRICGKGSTYTGCKVVPFEISASAISPTIAEIPAVVYTGSALKPAVVVKDGDKVIDKSNYTVSYSDNVNAGVASVEVNMKNNYTGKAVKSFTIDKAVAKIVTAPAASSVVFGKTLGYSTLSDGEGSVDGSFAWVNPDTLPTYRNDGYEVVFVPADEANYVASVPMTIPVVVIEKYNVVLMNGEEEIDNVVVDRDFVYTLPAAATKDHYTFDGWYIGDEKLGDAGVKIIVDKHMIIEAKYIGEKYEIRFINGNVLLSSKEYGYGEVPSYDGVPTKSGDSECNYKFSGWSPELATVTEAKTYTALFTCEDRTYEVVFVNGDDTLQVEKLAFGANPLYRGSAPVKASTEKYDYMFEGWSPSITAVSGDAVYSATFKAIDRIYVISVVSNDETMGSVFGGGNFKYGESVKLFAFAESGYEFSNWEDDASAAMNRSVTVTGDAEYKAVFKVIGSSSSSEVPAASSSSEDVAGSSSSDVVASSSSEEVVSSSSEVVTSSSSEEVASSSSEKVKSSSSVVASSSSEAKSSSSSSVISSSSSVIPSSSSVIPSVVEGSSSSAKSSSSEAKSSSSVKPASSSSSSVKSSSSAEKPKSSSSVKPANSSSSEKSDAIVASARLNFAWSVEGRTLNVSLGNASADSRTAKVAVFDMQGKLIVAPSYCAAGDLALELPRAGSYILRVGSQTARVQVK